MIFAYRLPLLLIVWTACNDGSDPSSDASTTSTDPSSTTSAPTDPGAPTSDGPAAQCGAPCDEPWTFAGDLELGAADLSTDQLQCMTRITGDLRIEDLDEVQLSGLQNLVTVDGALTIYSNTLADLSPFVCLETIGGRLEIGTAANLTDVTGMSALRSAQKLSFQHTGAAAVPTFSPGFTGPGVIEIENNPALVDLDGMSAWKPSDGGVYVLVRKNDRLESVTGLSGLLTGGATPASVWLERLPALPSLAGLEGITELGYVDLAYLPLVADLTPLAQLEKAERLSLAGLPLVQDLQGLSSLTTVGELTIGGCWEGAPGLDSLTSLAGLSSLTAVDTLDVQGNEQLLSLAGAEQLTAIAGGWSVEENPFLTVDAIDAFAAQVGQDPCDPSSDAMCACYEPDEPDEPEPDDEGI